MLLISLVVFVFVIYPFVPLRGPGRSVATVALTVILVSGSLSLRHQRRLMTIGVLLAAIALVTSWLGHYVAGDTLLIWSRASTILFLLLTSAGVLARVLRRGRVTAHRIQGAVAVYLMIGLTWGYGYSLVELLEPESFDRPAVSAGVEAEDAARTGMRDFVYLSFVTLTTLGYGDLTPVSPAARMLSILEALIGQLYLVTLVAHLVALQVADLDRKPEAGDLG